MIQIQTAMTVIGETVEKNKRKRGEELRRRIRYSEKESLKLLNFNWLIYSYILPIMLFKFLIHDCFVF